MRFLFLILFFSAFVSKGQDRIFLKGGKIKNGIVSSIGNDFVFFKNSDSSLTIQRIAKAEVMLVEKYDGKIYIFSKENFSKDSTVSPRRTFKNSLGCQPLNVFLGRLTVNYEYLNKSGKIGVVIPLSLTFDPVGILYRTTVDSTRNSSLHTRGFNFIGGVDINFYAGKGDFEGFFLGPRIRYGTDMFLQGTEAYSLQNQFGWRLTEPDDRLSQHISIGIGFVRILASPGGNRISSKQSYGWLSVNYRVGFNF
jgi:hypothetical protein